MNLDKIIELIAEQIAREVLEGSEDHPDREAEEEPAMSRMLWRMAQSLTRDESRIRFFRVWCQRSILPWVWGWRGAPRIWRMPLSSSRSARAPAT